MAKPHLGTEVPRISEKIERPVLGPCNRRGERPTILDDESDVADRRRADQLHCRTTGAPLARVRLSQPFGGRDPGSGLAPPALPPATLASPSGQVNLAFVDDGVNGGAKRGQFGGFIEGFMKNSD